MSSFVIVTDARNRQHKVATTPAKPLTEILQEACKRAQVDATVHTLKHGKQLLDCSLTVRFAGLPAGAKLDLVAASRKIGQVSLALDVAGAARLKASCSSSSTLWDVLCTFEGQNVALTARAAQTDSRKRAQPVLTINNRVFETDAVLRSTTLAALGIQQGSAVFKVAFRDTEEKLAEQTRPAATQIVQPEMSEEPAMTQPAISSPAKPVEVETGSITQGPIERNLVILLPSQDVPVFAKTDEDPQGPSIDQARRYLSLLQQSNRASQEPLMTRAQREAREASAAQTLRSELPNVLKFKFRFSSQVAGGIQALAEFYPKEEVASLYDFVASLLQHGQSELFQLETGYPDRRLLARYAPGTLQGLGFGAATALQVVPTASNVLKPRDGVLSQAVEAKAHVEKRRVQEESEAAKEEESIPAPPADVATSSAKESSSGGKKVPKWLKMGKR